MIKKSINAFSIAEVLVTMLVVSLVVVMSMPVITRKKLNANARVEGGYWECKLNSNGQHVSSDGAGTDRCVFTRPEGGVKEYSILVIGGGGGGAAGSDNNFRLSSYGNPVSGEVPMTATYNWLLVGGGGGGASHQNRVTSIACNGGAGGFASGSLYLNQGTQVHLSAGIGGSGGYTPTSSDSTADSAAPGMESVLTVVNTGSFVASGGPAGDSTKTSGCQNRFLSSSYLNQINEFTDIATSASLFGRGGLGYGMGTKADSGNNGVALLKGDILTGGDGGRAGEVIYKSMKSLPSQVVVKVGAGGAGGREKGADGEQGQPSAFGTYAVATGGAGGKAGAVNVSNSGSVAGLEGEESPLGGKLNAGSGSTNAKNDMDVNDGFAVAPSDMYGAGGGGGGYKKLGSEDDFGKGGRGASGYVRVEWN